MTFATYAESNPESRLAAQDVKTSVNLGDST